MNPWLAVFISTVVIVWSGLSFFLFTYPRLKKELQDEIDRDVRNNLDEINSIKSRIGISIIRIISSAAFLLTVIVLLLIYKVPLK